VVVGIQKCSESSKIGADLHSSSATTKGGMDKRRWQHDSAHQIVQSGGGRWFKNAPIWSILQQPEELWTNGVDTWIQRIKEFKAVVVGWSDKNAQNLRNDENGHRRWVESFFICGSFTWLYYNRTKILENQTLLLVLPSGLLVRLFKEFLARPVLWLSQKLSLIQLESPSWFP